MSSVHSINFFAFTVPDIREAERFYTAFGLNARRSGKRLELYTHDRASHTDGLAHRWGLIEETSGKVKQLQFISFGCFKEDLEKIRRQAAENGCEQCEPHSMGSPEGLWLRHPEGFLVQVVVSVKSSLDAKVLPPPREPDRLGAGRSPNRSKVSQVQPRRLSHLLLFSAMVPQSVTFFENVLGLRVSDRSGDHVVFMHAPHGCDHHLVAMTGSSGPGLHHVSWDVATLDEVGLGMEQMMAAGYERGWGVGRHVLGSNYFYYVRDPWGSYCEYSFDIDFVPSGIEWPAGDHPGEDSFYLWGPKVPNDFAHNFELEASAS